MKSFLSERFKKLSPPLLASAALMFTQLIQKGLQLITAPIYTRLLTPDEYGQVSLFFSWYEIMVIFTGLCLSKGVFNNGMMEFKSERDKYTFSMYSLTFLSTCVVGSVVILFSRFIYNFMKLPMNLICYMFVLLLFEAALSLWTVRQRFEYKWKLTTFITLSLAVLAPTVGILSVILLPKYHVYGRIIGERTVFLLVYLFFVIYHARRAKFKISTQFWKFALKFNLPLIPHYLSLHILNHMDRIMIASIIDESAAGIYSVAYSGAAVIKMFWQSINASLIPWTYEKCEKKDYKRLNDVTIVLVFTYAMICIIFMFLAPEIMQILAPKSYHEGIYIIPSVVAGVYFSALYYIFANVVYYYKMPKYVMIGSVVSAIVNIILNAIFIPIFGYIAAGYTTMASYMLQVFVDYIAMVKILKFNIYNMKIIGSVSATVVLVGIALSFVFEYTIVRYLLLVIFIGFTAIYVIKNKEIFQQLLRRKKK
ncbi:MAG: oligosaccharide flippase family protein [Oscillospiraceae bacterium]|nr:oligosaccharide flippase family protein [Oscillospiraceae bacterium]